MYEIRCGMLSQLDSVSSCGTYEIGCGMSTAVLVMDKAGSVGLDLSFVSAVFLMEPLSDPALEQQVVSRAHRMGAKCPILVETLVMKARAHPLLTMRMHPRAVCTLSSVQLDQYTVSLYPWDDGICLLGTLIFRQQADGYSTV